MEGESLFEKIEKIKMPIRILILVGTLALLVGIFAWRVHFPKTKEIATTTKEIAGLKNKLNKAKIRSLDLILALFNLFLRPRLDPKISRSSMPKKPK